MIQKTLSKNLILLILTGLLLFLPSSVALAHANLVRSDPERGAVLAQAPKSITLEFSENLDAQLSQVQLLDAHGQVIVKGPGAVDNANPRVLHLDLPKLPDGVYSAVWQTHSATDGHFANGTVGFSVGKSNPNVSLLPADTAALPTETIPTLAEILIRWAGYLAAALLGGGIAFAALVWSPAYRAAPAPNPDDDRLAARLLKKQVILSAAALALITVLALVYQAAVVVSSGSQPNFWAALAGLFNFNTNWQVWLRFILLAAIVFFAVQLSLPGSKFPLDWLVLVPLVILILATFSLKSHAAGLNDPLAVVSDVIHLTAMSAWFGGLLPLFLVLRRTQVPPALLVTRFTRVALVGVSVLFLTGLYNSVVQVRSLDDLFSTSYGLALIAKVAIFGVLVGLGALNFLVLTPRFRKDAGAATRQMRLSIRFELLFGFALLAVVGILTGASPSFEAVQAKRQMGVVGEYSQDGIRMRLWLAPGFTGENEVAVDLSGLPAADQNAATQVILRFKLLDQDLGTVQAQTATRDQERYLVRGSYFTLSGNWNVQAILRRPNQFDILHDFAVTIQTDPNDTDPPNPEAATSDSVASGKVLYQQNCVLCHGASGRGDGPAGLALNPPPADLTYHTMPGVHTDGNLFYWISQGLPRTAMPQFAQTLSEQQRWDLVNFIRTLARKTK